MDKEIRDFLLETVVLAGRIRHGLKDSPLSFMHQTERLETVLLEKKAAELYSKLADKKDLALLDKKGRPEAIIIGPINKTIQERELPALREAMGNLPGDSFNISFKTGELTGYESKHKTSKKEECTDCGIKH